MDNERTVAAELHRLAENEAHEPIDALQLVARGRRGLRRRRLFTAGGAVAGVAAIALAVSVLPGLGATEDPLPVASGSFEPVPGVPGGEAGAGQKLTKEEATRRCDLRYPEHKGRELNGNGPFWSGRPATYGGKDGSGPATSPRPGSSERPATSKLDFAVCVVPGGDKPSAALVAAAAKDPAPTTAAGQLRNCSVQTWVDLTGWSIVASDQSPRLRTAVLVAISPSGQKAVACQLDALPANAGQEFTNSQFLTVDALDPNDPITTPGKGSKHANLFAGGGGGGGYCPGTPCSKNYFFTGWGRVPSSAATVSIKMGTDPAHVVPVTDGWFALSYVSKSDHSTVKNPPTITAYDKRGKVVKVVQP
ncbi:hypothetical protein [Kribbella sp. HUAS MG21]|uniref:Uncharacterized protein n=1 Tax=Kribbella sp. HUAS MG21 TaxID=3160966 RepID=A0AAU7TM96_9ACTN